MVERVCVMCGVTFDRNHNVNVCSVECKLARAELQSLQRSAARKQSKKPISCNYCSNFFTPVGSNKSCSKLCAAERLKFVEKKWKINNRSALVKKKSEDYYKNWEKRRAQNRAWREKNKERVKELEAKYRDENIQKVIDYQRDWRDANKQAQSIKARIRKENSRLRLAELEAKEKILDAILSMDLTELMAWKIQNSFNQEKTENDDHEHDHRQQRPGDDQDQPAH